MWGKLWGPEEISCPAPQNCSTSVPHCRTAALKYSYALVSSEEAGGHAPLTTPRRLVFFCGSTRVLFFYPSGTAAARLWVAVAGLTGLFGRQ